MPPPIEKNDYDFDVLKLPDKSITRDAVEIDRIIRESKLKIKKRFQGHRFALALTKNISSIP